MQRHASSASNGSWQASIQFPTQPSAAWRRHIAAIAAYIPAPSPSPNPRRFHHANEPSTIESSQELNGSDMAPCADTPAF
jgi:hypothetical protein